MHNYKKNSMSAKVPFSQSIRHLARLTESMKKPITTKRYYYNVNYHWRPNIFSRKPARS